MSASGNVIPVKAVLLISTIPFDVEINVGGNAKLDMAVPII